jgi:hypothetical protein
MLQQRAIPDYKRLAQTPRSKSQRQLREQVRLGSGRKDIRIKGLRPTIPHLQSGRQRFSKNPIRPVPMTVSGEKRLHIPETPSQYPFASARQVTSKHTMPRQFINKSDRPFTDRQVARLHRKQLGGEYNHSTRDEIKKLLEVSAGVGRQVLAHLRPQQLQQPNVIAEPAVRAEPHQDDVHEPAQEEKEQEEYIAERKASKRKRLKQAQTDLDELESQYPTMSKEEQKQLLKAIRTRYKAKKMANVNVLKKTITAQVDKWKR